MPLPHDRDGSGPRLVLVHGFTQTRRCWGPVGPALAIDHEVVRVDVPGHGAASDLDVAFPDAAALIGDTGGPATYLGYSMGGRLALRLALDRPDRIERLVLIGASPGLADPVERAARRAADETLAARIEATGVAPFLDDWLALPLFAGLTPEAQCRDERLRNTAAGLASSLRRVGTGAQDPLWDRLSGLTMPVLLVVGAQDAKFTAIAEQMIDGIGAAKHRDTMLLSIPGAGHTAHLEAPDAFVAGLRDWLRG